MNSLIGNLFDLSDRIQEEALNQRQIRNKVLTSNIANAETPGYRAIGFSFEDHLRAMSGNDEPFAMKTTHENHFRSTHLEENGTLHPDVFVRPTESVPEDGNTVDIDKEMALLSKNQLLYRTAVELLNRKIGVLRYAITGGGR